MGPEKMGSGGMGMSQAMDILDEYKIDPRDFPVVMAAIEMVMGSQQPAPNAVAAPPPPPPPPPEAPMGMDPQQAMADEMFASGRNRKAL